MCGIAGIVDFSRALDNRLHLLQGGQISARAVVERMVARLGHRGPDARAIEPVGGDLSAVSLGHARLAILDLSPAGRQPMVDAETGTWITCNGEVYNYAELRPTLSDSPRGWISKTDTEVVLRAYARWGRDCLDRLDGMFAFAIWDAQQKVLFLARDRLGIKPLYYYAGDGFFIFASEVRALLTSGLVPPRLDPVALWQYLTYQSIPAPRTLLQGIRALPAGSWLTVDHTGKIREGRYWDSLQHASPAARTATEPEGRHRVAALLRDAVTSHLVSDVPLGAFLSGGIDSSAVVALMREAGQIPRTFSVVFPEKNYDEAQYARQIAKRFHTDHSEILLTERELLDQLPDALAAMDQPTGDGINTYVLARAVRSSGVKVALSGLGGDELFAGYPSSNRLGRVARGLRLWGYSPAAVRTLAGKGIRALGRSSVAATKAAAVVESDGTIAATFPVMRQVLSVRQRRTLLREPWLGLADGTPDPYVSLLRDAYKSAPWAGPLTQVAYAEGRTYMHDVLLRDTDQMSMAHALEVRVPLLDHRLVEYVMGLADSHKRPGETPKRLLVESLKGLLPEDIVQRPKQGFTLPFDPWMRGALRGFCEDRLSATRVESRGLFRPQEVQSLWRAFLDGRADVSWSRLWVLVVLEEWLERNGVTGQ
jgi:asparagine synthase (glutamine-hydrolysing)